MPETAYRDTFAADRLPPRSQWPDFRFDLHELRVAAQVNAAEHLLGTARKQGWGARVALRSARAVWSYDELDRAANRVARVLVEDYGLVPGNRVLLRGANSLMLAAAWLGVIKAGGIAVATMPLLRARELGQVIAKAQISHALCEHALRDELLAAAQEHPILRHVAEFHTGAGLEARMATKPAHFEACPTRAEDVALIAFTSGTTGTPKGTAHFHRDVLAICECFPRSMLAARDDDVFCGTPPLAFTFGLGGLLLFPLRYGASAVLLDRPTPEAMLRTVQDTRATVLFTAPTFYRMMAPLTGAFDLGSLTRCVSAGEALPMATRSQWRQATGIEIIDGIGTTEMLHIFIAAVGADVRPGATGKPIPGYQACVLDPGGRPLPPGQVGRLAVRGPTGCRYLDDTRQSEYVQGGWNITGDAYRVDEDGYFWFESRTDDLIVSAGYNIAGIEVEEALLGHPAVAECGVVGAPDALRGQIVKAYVVLRPGHAPGPVLAAELQTHVKQALAPYKYPREIAFVASLPRTETGKLQRFRLRPP